MRAVAIWLVLLVALSCATPASASAQTRHDAALIGDSLMARAETVAAISAYRRAVDADPDDVLLRAKLALALASRVEETPGRGGDEPLLREAIAIASDAVRSGPRLSRAYTALSVSLARYAYHLAHEHRVRKAREVIDLGRQAKQAADYALELDPGDFAPYAILGVWHRELATVHPAAKAVARVFLGGYPDVSLEESEQLLVRAVELAPERVMLRTQLALTYLAMDRVGAARRQLEIATAGEPRNRFDEIERERATALLERLP